MFNPFHESVMKAFVGRLERWLAEGPPDRRCTVAYMNPAHGYLFQDSPFFREVESLRKTVSLYPYDSYPVVIFEACRPAATRAEG
jgi:hypothetical protein